MQIGTLKLDNNILLAPMAGITDLPFRVICKEQGAGLVYTEMVSAKGIYYNDKKTERLTEINETEKPAAVQIFGSDPDIMASIVKRLNTREDIALIDINMGCPAPKIIKNGEGSCLMREPDLVKRIIDKVVNASDKPVTVKIRKGWDEESINAVEIAEIARENGTSAVTVHGRTREQHYSGKADWSIIKEVKKAVDIPVIGNGDVFTPEHAKELLEFSGCDAVMIGRGAQGNPWIFSRTIHYLNTGEMLPYPTDNQKLQIILKHFDMMERHKGEHTAVKEMRKHIAWYIKGMPNAAKMRTELCKESDKAKVIGLLVKYFGAE